MLTEKQRKTISRLKNLQEDRITAANIRERIDYLESTFSGIKAAKTDGDPVSGGTNHREDALIDNIKKRDELSAKLKDMLYSISELERTIETLTGSEKEIVNRIYISGEKYAVDRLSEELRYSQATIYRMRNVTIRKLSKRLYED